MCILRKSAAAAAARAALANSVPHTHTHTRTVQYLLGTVLPPQLYLLPPLSAGSCLKIIHHKERKEGGRRALWAEEDFEEGKERPPGENGRRKDGGGGVGGWVCRVLYKSGEGGSTIRISFYFAAIASPPEYEKNSLHPPASILPIAGKSGCSSKAAQKAYENAKLDGMCHTS